MDILVGIVQNGKTKAKTYAGHYIEGVDAVGRYAINNGPQGEGTFQDTYLRFSLKLAGLL